MAWLLTQQIRLFQHKQLIRNVLRIRYLHGLESAAAAVKRADNSYNDNYLLAESGHFILLLLLL